jgi:methyl-accepting chemotaxis protein
MTLSPTRRTFQFFLPIDAPFALIVPFVYLPTLGLDFNRWTLGVAFAAIAVRTLAWVLALLVILRPLEAWHRTPPERRTAAILQRADHVASNGASHFALLYALCWSFGVFVPALVFIFVSPERTPLPVRAVSFGTFLVGAVCLGSAAFSLPLVRMLLEPWGAELASEAEQRKVVLDRPARSLKLRFAALGICLAIAPALWIAGVGYTAEIRAQAQEAAARAQLEVWRLSAGEPVSHAAAFVDALGATSDNVKRELERLPNDLQNRIRAAGPAIRVETFPHEGRVVAYRRVGGSGVALSVVSSEDIESSGFVTGVLWFMLILIMWAPLCAYLLARSVSGPLTILTDTARALIERGRLTELKRAPVSCNDEVGALAEQFNALIRLLRDLSEAANHVAAGNLAVEVRGQGDLPEAFALMVENLRAMVHQIGGTSVQLASAATQIYAAAQEQEAAATTQSAAVEEISRTMESLANAAAHVAEAVKNVLSNAERTSLTTDQMVARIGELNGHTHRIGEILDVIRDISDRSDLLALNGSLEASRAGDAGRGFSVVASEMRRLAERVTGSVTDIKAIVGDVRASGASTVMATEESKKLAAETNDAARQITRVVQQQLSGTEQASQSIKEVAQVISQTAAATSQTRTSAEDLKQQADELAELVSRFRLAAA